MSKINILDKVSSFRGGLTKKGDLIASSLLSDPTIFVEHNLAELAKILNVGEATIIRFCNYFGYKGFYDFKVALNIDLAINKNSSLLDDGLLETESGHAVALQLNSFLSSVMSETINLLDFNEIDKVVDKVINAKRLFLFGMGSSGITAQQVKHKYMRIGFYVDAVTDTHSMYMQAALMNKNDVIIGISHSGKAQEIIKSLQLAKASKACTVALTHSAKSPITKYADYVLVNGNKQEERKADSIGTTIAQLFVLDLIYALIVKKDLNKAMSIKQKTINALH